mgnify:CR=1 FL=1
MKKKFIFGLFGLLVCLFTASMVSCGDDEEEGSSGEGGLIGTWVMTQSHQGESFTQTLKIEKTTWTLTREVSYTYEGQTETQASRIGGSYTVADNVVTAISTIEEFTGENGKWISEENPQPITYIWKYEIKGNQLSITTEVENNSYTEVYTRK